MEILRKKNKIHQIDAPPFIEDKKTHRSMKLEGGE